MTASYLIRDAGVPKMTAIKIQYYADKPHLIGATSNRLVFPTEGCHIEGTGKVAGIFRTIKNAIAGDGHEDAILSWDKLTAEEQVIAKENSQWLANRSD